MARLSRWFVFAASFALAAAAGADDLPPQSPIDLARGLRESGHADLALEYLSDVAGKLPPDAAAVLPLERAKCRLELANEETDDGIRQGVTAQALGEFRAFLRATPNHPRAAEAEVAMARLDSLQGKLALSRANRVAGDARKAERAKTRDQFASAAAEFKGAAAKLQKRVDDPALAPQRKKELTRELYQAKLDEGINLYTLGDTYDAKDKADRDPRDKAYSDAERLFDELSKKDATNPLCWVARAWVGECLLQRSEITKGENQFKAVFDDANKGTAPPAAAAGVRSARFFQLRDKYLARGARPDATPGAVRDACERWLASYPAARPTTEHSAVRYYLGRTLFDETLANKAWLVLEKDPTTKEERVVGVKNEGVTKMRQAEAQFHVISETENEYTERAERERTNAVRLLIGAAELPPEKYLTFDECNMAALVQLDKVRTTEDDEKRKQQALKAVALLERARQLPVTKDQARDADLATVSLARAYTAAGRPHQAAVLAEHVARTSRSPKVIAQAGLSALFGYASAAETADIADETSKPIDLNRAVAVATFTEQAAANDPVTDAVRFQHARLLNGFKKYPESFAVLHTVRPAFPGVAAARLVQGGVAFEILRSRPDADPAGAAPLTPAQRAAIYSQAVDDLSAVPAPAATAKPEDWLAYLKVRVQLAQVHLTNYPAGYPLAEKLAADAMAAAEKAKPLSAEQRASIAMPAESVRIDATYGQAAPLLKDGKYKEAADLMTPLLADVVKSGPAVKANQDAGVAELAKALDKNRMTRLLVPTLNARVREGAVDKTGELLDQLQKFGGDLKTSAAVVYSAVSNIKPTVDALRKEGKADEANKLVEAVGGLIAKLDTGGNLPPEVKYNLGRSYSDLGEYTKAAALLSSVPAPVNAGLLKGDVQPPAPPENETPEDKTKRETAWEAEKTAAIAYKFSQLELIRAYREGKQFDKAAEVLDATMGKEGMDKVRTGGWAARQLDFRKEALFLAEAKGQAAGTAKDAVAELVVAQKGWNTIVGEYMAAMQRRLPADATEEQKGTARRTKEMLKPIWQDVSYEKYRGDVAIQTALVKYNAKKAEESLTSIGNHIAKFDSDNKDLTEATRAKFAELIDTAPPQVKKGYVDKGGKDFLAASTPAVGSNATQPPK